MRERNKIWCTHVGQEIPVLVYALLMCKPVDLRNLPKLIPQVCFFALG